MITVDSLITFAQANPFKTGIVGYGSIHLLFRWVYTLIGKLLKAIYNASKRLLFRTPNIPQDGANSLSESTDSNHIANPLFNQPVDLLSPEQKEIQEEMRYSNINMPKSIKKKVILPKIPEDDYLDLTK